MPFKLVPPDPSRSPYWRVRGTEFRIPLNRSTKTRDRREAAQFLASWREEAKRLSISGPIKAVPTFADAALAYMQAGGERRFVAPLLRHFGEMPLSEITQIVIDRGADKLFPQGTAATRNRCVYSPMSAILRRAGVAIVLRRPKGAQGERRTGYLSEAEAFALLDASDAQSPRFGALMAFLLYTGVRLSEALRLSWPDVDFERRSALIGKTKNGRPLTVHLPPPAIGALAGLPDRTGKVFRLTKSGRLYHLLADAEKVAKLTLPPRTAFHILRHTHATWRRLYAGADTSSLVHTGLWRSRAAASVYEHLDVSAESQKSDLLPVRPGEVFSQKLRPRR